MVIGGLIVLVGFGSALAYLPLQVYTVIRMRGVWRIVAIVPFLPMVRVFALTAYAYADESSLWPILMIFAAPVGTGYLAVLLIVRRSVTERRKKTAEENGGRTNGGRRQPSMFGHSRRGDHDRGRHPLSFNKSASATNKRAIPSAALTILRRKRRCAFSSGESLRSALFCSDIAGWGRPGGAAGSTGAPWNGADMMGRGAIGIPTPGGGAMPIVGEDATGGGPSATGGATTRGAACGPMTGGGMGIDEIPANVTGGGPYVTGGRRPVTGGRPRMMGGAPTASGGAPTATGGTGLMIGGGPAVIGGGPVAIGGGAPKTGGAAGTSTRPPQPGQSVSRPAIDASICAVAPQLGQPN